MNKGGVPDYLKFERVYPFTRDPEFKDWMEDVFEFIRQQVPADQDRYSKDWVSQGLTGLANAVDRKGSRLFDLMSMNMVGKDKIEDEFRDALMEAFYAYVYYMVLRRRHGPENSDCNFQRLRGNATVGPGVRTSDGLPKDS